MIEHERCATDDDDTLSEAISPFDAAAYIYQLSAELARMARDAALFELARKLEEARDHSALDMIAVGVHAGSPRPNSGDAA